MHVSTPNLQTISIPAEATTLPGDQYGLLFSSNRPLGSSPAPPDLSLPDIPYENSSSPPESPTPPALNSSLNVSCQQQLDSHAVQEMLVDGDISNNTPAIDNPTPTLLPKGLSAPEDPEDDVPAPDLTPLHDHLLDNEDYQRTIQQNKPSDPLDKYMKCDMPLIHDANPSSCLDFIDARTIVEWDSFPTHQLLAIPFGFEAREHHKHHELKKQILAAVADITKAKRAGVTAPGPTDRLIRQHRRTPRAFLIHGLTEEQYYTLLKQRIWVSTDISFRIAVKTPTSPDLVFTITDLTDLEADKVFLMVSEVWRKDSTLAAINEVIIANNPNPIPDIIGFLASMRVEELQWKEKGNVLSPQYNVYAKGKLIKNHKLWSKIRKVLASLQYYTPVLGEAIVKIGLHHCNSCHGANHPTGMCPFLALSGWKGPDGLSEHARQQRRNSQNPPMSSHQFGRGNQRR